MVASVCPFFESIVAPDRMFRKKSCTWLTMEVSPFFVQKTLFRVVDILLCAGSLPIAGKFFLWIVCVVSTGHADLTKRSRLSRGLSVIYGNCMFLPEFPSICFHCADLTVAKFFSHNHLHIYFALPPTTFSIHCLTQPKLLPGKRSVL